MTPGIADKREATMATTVRIHGELLPDLTKLVWWAESSDVPGFSATAETLVELRELVHDGLAHALGDRALDADALHIRYELVNAQPEAGPAVASPQHEAHPAPTSRVVIPVA